jgi:ribosome maturation factor RimP
MIPDQLRKGIEESVARAGAQVIDLIIRGEKGTRVVEVFVDSEGGVTSDLCSTISKDVSKAIEESDLLQGAYRLDISSPGIDRPLRFPWQYRKHIGRALQVKSRGGDEAETIAGVLLAVEEDVIVIQPGKKDPGRRILFRDVLEARVKAPW